MHFHPACLLLLALPLAATAAEGDATNTPAADTAAGNTTAAATATTTDTAPATTEPAWKGSLDAGITDVAGNTRSRTLLGSSRLEGRHGAFSHLIEAGGKNISESSLRTAEQYRVAGKESWNMSEADYLFGYLAWDKDRFNGYEWQLTAAAGYGRKLLHDERHTLSVEAGPGFRHDELPNDDSEDHGLLRAAAQYDLAISEKSHFLQRLEGEFSEDDTLSRSLTELGYRLNASLLLSASLEIRRNDNPPAGTRNSDRTTAIKLGWAF
jgi:putative salt-induced outer membrane protein